MKIILLEKGEKPLVSWKCLLSMEEKVERTRDQILTIVMLPLTGQYGSPETFPGHVVLTNRKLAFVESGLLPKSQAWRGAIPLEHITEISSNGELVVTARSMGWKWCLRRLELEGFPGVGTDLATVTGSLREAVDSRKRVLSQEKKDRRQRIEEFNRSRKKK